MSEKIDYSLDALNPRLEDLLRDYVFCSPGSMSGGWNRNTDAMATRFAEWAGQSPDGKKHSSAGLKAMPWEGASDQRVFLADGLVDMTVDMLVVAFWRETVQAEGINADDVTTAGVARTMLRYFMRNKLWTELSREVELSAQICHTFGHTMLHVTWDRELGRRWRSVTVADVRAFDDGAADAVMDPTREEEALYAMRSLYETYLAVEVSQIDRDEVPDLPDKELRRYVRALRKDGECKVPLPYVARNQPCVRALRPWQDVFSPEDLGDVQRSPMFVRELLRVEEVIARVNSRKWDRAWAEAAIKTKGFQTIFNSDQSATINKPAINTRSQFVEVVTAYTRRLDEEEVPGVYVTVFCPHVRSAPGQGDLVAQHGLLDYAHGLTPIVALTSEWTSRSVTQARGIPERAAPAQRLIKVERDSQIDRASITTLPPRLVPLRGAGDEDIFGPGAAIPVTAGREPKFMAMPQYDGVSDRVQAQTRQDVAWQFGQPTESAAPQAATNRAQRQLNAFFMSWTEVFQQMWALALQYCSDSEFQKVVGVPKPSSDEIAGRFGIMLAMDVRQMDTQYALKELEAISQHVLPEDSAGMIDRSQLMQMKLSALSPLLANRLVQPKQGASQKVYDQVAGEWASMFLGNPPKPVENDPTCAIQLQFAQQIIMANKKYQQALVSDPGFKMMAMAWMKNRQMSVKQEQNKTVGRIGVSPEQMQGNAA